MLKLTWNVDISHNLDSKNLNKLNFIEIIIGTMIFSGLKMPKFSPILAYIDDIKAARNHSLFDKFSKTQFILSLWISIMRNINNLG